MAKLVVIAEPTTAYLVLEGKPDHDLDFDLQPNAVYELVDWDRNERGTACVVVTRDDRQLVIFDQSDSYAIVEVEAIP